MTNPAPVGAGTITQCPASKCDTDSHRAKKLKALCRSYLSNASALEAVDNETDRLTRELGSITSKIAELLGPLDHPLIVEVEGSPVVINVAEGLLMPQQITASLSRAYTADDLALEGEA